MATRVGTHQAKTNLSEYLNRANYRGERFLVERHGKAVAALVSVEDLRRLEAHELDDKDEEVHLRAAFLDAAKELGLKITFPSGPPVLPEERTPPIQVPGRPISEDIIADRR